MTLTLRIEQGSVVIAARGLTFGPSFTTWFTTLTPEERARFNPYATFSLSLTATGDASAVSWIQLEG